MENPFPQFGHSPADFSLATHNAHVDSLRQHGDYDVFGVRFATAQDMYQPHPWSSSVFLVRSLLRERPRLGRLLELGCGAGVVGLSMLRHGLADTALLTDIVPACVEAARANIQALGEQGRAEVRLGDMFAPVRGGRFDSIIFNMPLLHLEHGGLHHPALDDAGGRLARHFFERAGNHLLPGGHGYFTFSNVSHASLLAEFARRATLRPLAAEWVATRGFGLALFEFTPDSAPC